MNTCCSRLLRPDGSTPSFGDPKRGLSQIMYLAVSLATAVLPHVLKSVFDQTRPDRLTVRGHAHGIPISGKPRDAFPSGHALHMGALASAAGLLASVPRRLVRSLAVALSLTRVVVLAHWASDVAAGFILGIVVERLFRPLTFGKWQRRQRPASRVRT